MINNGAVDAPATKVKRSELADGRSTVVLELSNEELNDGPRRQFIVPQATADALAISEGSLVELVTGRGAPLRAWVKIGGEGQTVVVSITSLDILGAAPGDRVQIRATTPRPATAA